MAGEIFISYRRADAIWARQLHSLLQAEGVEAWYDAFVGAGEDWRITTAQALEDSRIFVLLFSANAAASSDIAKELAAAVLEKKLIVPVRLENIAPKGAFLYELASRNWINAYENTETKLAELAKDLARQVRAGAQVPTSLSDMAKICEGPIGDAASNAAQDSVAERRLITVMSVDLVDTVRLSAEFDPELLADLLTSYKNCVARGIAAAGGRVVTSSGSGVLACFGWPEARENAAECAIRAGFLVIEEVSRLGGPQGHHPCSRVGIATGLVVVGGEVDGMTNAVPLAGEAPNLAIGLQRLASPGTMAISDATHRQVGRLFEFEVLPDQAVGGFSMPIRAWRPVRGGQHLSRFQAARAMKTSFVGRVHELSLLADRWQTASEGSGRTVVILAEAGMGKSRLVDALRHQIGDKPHASITWQCSPYHQTKPFYPIVEYVTHASGVVDADAPARQLQKLSGLLATAGVPLDGNLALFAPLLGIEPDAGFVPTVPPPGQVRAATIAALIEWLRRIAVAKPLLLVLEDAHWIDASTMELLTRLVGALVDMPLLTVITARQEFVSPWSGRAEVSTMGLDRLSNRDCETLVREVAGAAAVGNRMVAQILSRSDGNPLFVEELSAAVMETKAAGAKGVPDSLRSSLMARLDRLGDAKQTAQICSVLGRRFARPLLTRVAVSTPTQLDSHLALLVEHDVIRLISGAGQANYEFKHALVRDAAYESLLLSQRRQLHEACGRCLEEFFPDVARTEPELLAHHFGLAGSSKKASTYAEQAGDRATAACAFHEAIASYEEALRQNDLLSAGTDHSRQTLDLLLKLGPAIGMIRGAQDPILRDIYRRAEGLSRTADDNNALFKAVWGLWYHANISRELDDAGTLSQQLVDISARSGDEDLALEALHCRWSSALFRGDNGLCVTDARRGVELYDRHRHHKLGLVFGGHDPGVCALGCAGQGLVLAGDVMKGLASVEDAIALAEDLDHPGSLAHGLLMGMISTTVTRKPDSLQRYAENMLELSHKIKLPPQEAMANYHLGWVEAEVGDRTKGLDQMEALYDRVTAMGPMILLYKVMYIDQMLKAARAQDALSVADRAIAELRCPDVGLMLSELLRLRGDCLAVLGRRDEARVELIRAESMAERDGAALLRLRAANSLYREAGAESKQALELALAALPSAWDGPDVLLARALLTN